MNEEFWTSVSSGVTSGLISSFIITGVIATLIYYYRKPSISVELCVWSSVKKKRTFVFRLKNTGKMSLMPGEAQWYIYFEMDSFKVTDETKHILTTTNQGALYEFTGFNEFPCHPGTTSDILSVDVETTDSIPYDFIDDAPFYCTIYTSHGVRKPSIFSKERKQIMSKNGESEHIGYRISEITV